MASVCGLMPMRAAASSGLRSRKLGNMVSAIALSVCAKERAGALGRLPVVEGLMGGGGSVRRGLRCADNPDEIYRTTGFFHLNSKVFAECRN